MRKISLEGFFRTDVIVAAALRTLGVGIYQFGCRQWDYKVYGYEATFMSPFLDVREIYETLFHISITCKLVMKA